MLAVADGLRVFIMENPAPDQPVLGEAHARKLSPPSPPPPHDLFRSRDLLGGESQEGEEAGEEEGEEEGLVLTGGGREDEQGQF